MLLDLSDEELVGRSTPDPLRFAFQRKKSPHAGGMMQPKQADSWQDLLIQAHQTPSVTNFSPRCLYIHVPFCRVRCTYCNFFQYASSKTLIDDYVSALMKEIAWKAKLPWSQSAPFQAVYIGGGTPTDLSGDQIARIVKAIRDVFPLRSDCEITLEGRLNRFSAEKFEKVLDAGINRFSFGVQSFNTQVRKSAKRLDDRDTVLTTLQQLSAYKAAPIVIDLLYGLPHQTLDIWQQDLHDVIESGADGVDLYQLIALQNLPMARLVEQGKLPVPADTQEKATMFDMGVKFMAQHHMKRLSNNHWAKDNRERSLYNTLAKTRAEILPLGAGAGGNVNGLQMMHTRDIDLYVKAIEQENYPVAMVTQQPENQGLSAEIKSGFDAGMLAEKIFNRVSKKTRFSAFMPLFNKWQENGLVKINGDEDTESRYLTLTTAGQFWAVTLTQNLLGVLNPVAHIQDKKMMPMMKNQGTQKQSSAVETSQRG